MSEWCASGTQESDQTNSMRFVSPGTAPIRVEIDHDQHRLRRLQWMQECQGEQPKYSGARDVALISARVKLCYCAQGMSPVPRQIAWCVFSKRRQAFMIPVYRNPYC